jgi:hypothetical protein
VKGLKFGSILGFSTMIMFQLNKELSVKQFLAQKSVTEREHPPYFPSLALNDFGFQK